VKKFFLKTFLLFPFILFSYKANAIDEVQEANLFVDYGWMDATCYYYNQGFVPQSKAKKIIKTILEKMKNETSLEYSKRGKTLLLDKNPNCSRIVP